MASVGNGYCYGRGVNTASHSNQSFHIHIDGVIQRTAKYSRFSSVPFPYFIFYKMNNQQRQFKKLPCKLKAFDDSVVKPKFWEEAETFLCLKVSSNETVESVANVITRVVEEKMEEAATSMSTAKRWKM
jgi:hypothetical protein